MELRLPVSSASVAACAGKIDTAPQGRCYVDDVDDEDTRGLRNRVSLDIKAKRSSRVLPGSSRPLAITCNTRERGGEAGSRGCGERVERWSDEDVTRDGKPPRKAPEPSLDYPFRRRPRVDLVPLRSPDRANFQHSLAELVAPPIRDIAIPHYGDGD